MAVKGKWARGITPRNFTWIIKDQLAICERPGGYGNNHRKVRRQEEIIWIREQEFTYVISISVSPHNLHNYDEMNVPWKHRPFAPHDDFQHFLSMFIPELHELLQSGAKLIVHGEEVGDRLCGLMGGYLLWAGLIDSGPRAISATEHLTSRQLGPVGRELIAVAKALPGPGLEQRIAEEARQAAEAEERARAAEQAKAAAAKAAAARPAKARPGKSAAAVGRSAPAAKAKSAVRSTSSAKPKAVKKKPAAAKRPATKAAKKVAPRSATKPAKKATKAAKKPATRPAKRPATRAAKPAAKASRARATSKR